MKLNDYLPQEPDGFHYEIEKVSKLITKVWLVHEEDYDYAGGRVVKTIYAFIKGSKNLTVHKPKNAATAYVKSFCTLDDLSSQSPYSLYKPTDDSILKFYETVYD